ncbi:MAG: hypothetical protein ACLPID_00895 [Beijerinckiaceae bacterium]
MHSLVHGLHERVAARPRTLVASNGKIWLWPGIALTSLRGDQIVAASAETIQFWITRLHGPDALYTEAVHCIGRAAEHLTRGNETAAQRALDAIGLRGLSSDGAALMWSVAKRLDLEWFDMPVRPGPRCLTARDIAMQVPFFEEVFDRAAPLAKFGPFDPLKHPRWPAGAPDSQGGRFAPAGSENAQIVDVQYRGYYHDQVVNELVDFANAHGAVAIKSVPLISVIGLTCIADAIIKPIGTGEPYILEVKTGDDPTFTFNQALVYPMAVTGPHVTSFKADVSRLGLVPGLPFPRVRTQLIQIQ